MTLDSSRTPPDRDRPGRIGGFDAAAADFDALGVHLWQPLADATIEQSQPRGGELVLDACCGTGASAVPAARLVGPAGRVDAVDLSGPMIEVLHGKAHRLDLPQLVAYQHDVTSWPGQDYDLVQSVMGIFFLPDMVTATRGLIERCRPGGRVAFTIWRRGAMVTVGRLIAETVAEATGNAVAPREPHLMDEIDQPESYARWLTELGLDEVGVHVAELDIDLTPDVAWLMIIGSGFRGLLTGFDAETVDQVRRRYRQRVVAESAVGDATAMVGTGQRRR